MSEKPPDSTISRPTRPLKRIQVIPSKDWNNLVELTYGRPYDLQQQGGCYDRGVVPFRVPRNQKEFKLHDYKHTSLPEDTRCDLEGVSLATWLAREPGIPLAGGKSAWLTETWWHRKFYPSLEAVAYDLCEKGLLEPGEHSILIDW